MLLKEAFKPAGVSHAYASTEAGVAFNVIDGLEGFPVSFVSASQGSDVEMKIVDGSLRIRSDRTARAYVGIPDALHDAEAVSSTAATWWKSAAAGSTLLAGAAASSMSAA